MELLVSELSYISKALILRTTLRSLLPVELLPHQRRMWEQRRNLTCLLMAWALVFSVMCSIITQRRKEKRREGRMERGKNKVMEGRLERQRGMEGKEGRTERQGGRKGRKKGQMLQQRGKSGKHLKRIKKE